MIENNLQHDNITPYNHTESKKEQVEEMFDNIAERYDLLNHVLSMKIDVSWRNKLVKWVSQEKPQSILDVATGTGDLAIVLQKGTKADIVGYDLSQKMLNIGIEKVEKAGLGNHIKMVKGDAEKIPFENDSFDIVTSAFGVRNFENLSEGLKEMHRVVKSGGSIYILEFSKVKGVFGSIFNFYFKNILPKIGKIISKDLRAYTYLHDSANAFPYGEEMKKILLNVGFKKVEYKKLTFGISSIYKATK